MLEVTLVEPLSRDNLFYDTTSYTLSSSFPIEMLLTAGWLPNKATCFFLLVLVQPSCQEQSEINVVWVLVERTSCSLS